MFLLPSGPETSREGQDKEHPIVLEGYKKDEFSCLLKVMYPTTGSLISGLCMTKGEWVSVLKLSTIWNMKEIREYAIESLSGGTTLSPIEKILLARQHGVAAWLEEGVTSLVTRDPKTTLDDLAKLGWETAARILFIVSNTKVSYPNTFCFARDAIKCASCSSSSSVISSAGDCGHINSAATELTVSGPGLPAHGTAERLVLLCTIKCPICRGTPYTSGLLRLLCPCSTKACDYVRIRVRSALKTIVEKVVEEIKG